MLLEEQPLAYTTSPAQTAWLQNIDKSTWRKVKLGEVCEINYGFSLPDTKRIEGKFKVFGSNGVVGTHNEAFTKGKTIVIGRKGSVGKVNFSIEPCVPIDTTYYVEQNHTKFNIDFLSFMMQGLNLHHYNRATAVPGLVRKELQTITVLLPLSTFKSVLLRSFGI